MKWIFLDYVLSIPSLMIILFLLFVSSSRYTIVISAVDLETPDESVADWSIRRTYAQLQVN